MKRAVFAIAFAFALAGCATPPMDIDFDYDTGADYAALKTYNWMPATGNAAQDELLVKRIRASIDKGLQAKGRSLSDNPDFLIAMQLSGKTAYGGSVGMGVSVGIPVGRAGRVSVGGGKSKPIEKKEGTVVVGFLGAKNKGLVWQATAQGALEQHPTPEEQQQRIDEVVAEMLAKFPPKK